MDNDNAGMTEAQLQIERLKKLKENKDIADKAKKDDEFRFAELPHAITTGPIEKPVQHDEPFKETKVISEATAVPAIKRSAAKKTGRVSRIDRRNYERIKKTVTKIKNDNKGMRLSEDMFVNMILEKVLDLKLNFSTAKTSEEVRALLDKIKAE
jgi:hypothetical protein